MSLDRARAARYVITRRGELGLTQRQLATRANVDIKTIYNLESGERWPQAPTRSKIEQALGWEAGSLEAIAAGEQRSLSDSGEASESITVERRYDDPGLQALWEIGQLTEMERRLAISAVMAYRQTHPSDPDAGYGQDRAG